MQIVLFGASRVVDPINRGVVHVDGALRSVLRHAHEQLIAQAKGHGNAFVNKAAIVEPAQRLDKDRRYPVRRKGMIGDARSWRPLERKLADRSPQSLVVVPIFGGNHSIGKSGLMGEELQDRDVTLAVGGEIRKVRRDW